MMNDNILDRYADKVMDDDIHKDSYEKGKREGLMDALNYVYSLYYSPAHRYAMVDSLKSIKGWLENKLNVTKKGIKDDTKNDIKAFE